MKNSTQDNDSTTGQSEQDWEHLEEIASVASTALRQRNKGRTVDPGDALSAIQDELEDKTRQQRQAGDTGTPLYVPSGAIDYLALIRKAKETKMVGTGLPDLDAVLGGGLEPGRLMVLLGAPGGGKTTLVNQMAVHAADSGRAVLYVSSEDSPFTLLSKTLARQGKIPYTAVLKGDDDEMPRITEVLRTYQESKAARRLCYLDATMGVPFDKVKRGATDLFEQFKSDGNGILVIDYLQRLARAWALQQGSHQELRGLVSSVTERLRALASELCCTVLALAAQHRASGYDANKSALNTGKESGDIEYTADVLMSIGDDMREERILPQGLSAKILRVDKNRQGVAGDTCSIDLDWYGTYQQFTQVFDERGALDGLFAEASSNGRKKGGRK